VLVFNVEHFAIHGQMLGECLLDIGYGSQRGDHSHTTLRRSARERRFNDSEIFECLNEHANNGV
jgi:hypothetical protein